MPLKFDNRFVRLLPGENTAQIDGSAQLSRKVLNACYSNTRPVKPSDPKLLAHASEVAELIGLSPSEVAINLDTGQVNSEMVEQSIWVK
jgi:hypothetical protein